LLKEYYRKKKNGGFRANPLAKYRRLSFSATSLRIFGHSCTTKCAMYHLRTGAATFATLVYRCLSALLRTEKDKAREENLREFTKRK
jgi:hypothetical protein